MTDSLHQRIQSRGTEKITSASPQSLKAQVADSLHRRVQNRGTAPLVPENEASPRKKLRGPCEEAFNIMAANPIPAWPMKFADKQLIVRPNACSS